MVQKTFVMIKPDGVRKKIIGEIISRFEKRGLEIEASVKKSLDLSEAKALYSIHEGRPFFDSLIEFVTSGPVVLLVLSGDSVIEIVRKMMGATDPKEALPGTIRGDFAIEIGENIIHGSDSEQSANREIPIFFPELV